MLKAFKKFLDKITLENKKSFGSSKLDFSELNKNKNKRFYK